MAPSHLATTAVANGVAHHVGQGTAHVRKWSIPKISNTGLWQVEHGQHRRHHDERARGTPAIPLLDTISTSSMVICADSGISTP